MRRVQILIYVTVATLLVANGCGDSSPHRLVIGLNDTLVVNNMQPMHIPVRAVDVSGDDVPVTGVRYDWVSGDSIPVSANGVVHCTRNADATILISLDAISRSAVVRCRPIVALRAFGPMQLVVGEMVQKVEFEAIGLDGKPVDLVAGSMSTMRSDIVGIEPALRVRAKVPGVSLTTLYVGDRNARLGIHVYQRVRDLRALNSGSPGVALALRLNGGETQRWPLPVGSWMITMTPYEDESRGLRIMVHGASCSPMRISPRRQECTIYRPGATLEISHPSGAGAPALTGELFIFGVKSEGGPKGGFVPKP